MDVRERYDPAAARVDLEFLLQRGPHVRVVFGGVAPPAGARRSVERLLREAGASPDALEQGVDVLEAELRRAGHREPDVSARQETGPGALTLLYEVEPGPRAVVARVEARGLEALDLPWPCRACSRSRASRSRRRWWSRTRAACRRPWWPPATALRGSSPTCRRAAATCPWCCARAPAHAPWWPKWG